MKVNSTALSSLDEEIRTRMQDWKEAFESKDVDSIMAFYAPEGFTAFDLMPPFQFEGGEMWRKNWVNFYEAFDGPIELELADLRVYAQADLAIARCAVRLDGTMFGHHMDSWVRTTNCFQRIEGEWLMIHDHVSWPTDFATDKALKDLTPAGAER
ncbi:YybH family protein [Streptomyces tauricus]